MRTYYKSDKKRREDSKKRKSDEKRAKRLRDKDSKSPAVGQPSNATGSEPKLPN